MKKSILAIAAIMAMVPGGAAYAEDGPCADAGAGLGQCCPGYAAIKAAEQISGRPFTQHAEAAAFAFSTPKGRAMVKELYQTCMHSGTAPLTWQTSCIGRLNKSHGWMLEGAGGDICKFNPAAVAEIVRVCGGSRCEIMGTAVSIPTVRFPGRIDSEFGDVLLTDITSIRRVEEDTNIRRVEEGTK